MFVRSGDGGDVGTKADRHLQKQNCSFSQHICRLWKSAQWVWASDGKGLGDSFCTGRYTDPLNRGLWDPNSPQALS